MKRLGTLAVALAIALTACTRVATTQSGAGTGAAGSSGTAQRHGWTRPGVLRIASLQDPDTLNPLLGTFQIDTDLSLFWGAYLFKYDDHGQDVPELATAVPTAANGGIAKDGLTITYHLRRGVLWQDGRPFDADDVVFTWHAVMNPNNNVQTRVGYDLIRTIETPDKYTLIVRLKQPFAPFVETFFAMSATTYPVLPKHLLAAYPDINRIPFNSAPVGTGPFIVKEWHRGQILRMVANPHYWRGAPKLTQVTYQVIPDENTLTTSMKAHDIDLWTNASSTNYPTASNIPATRAVLTPFVQYSFLGFNLQRPITSELAVRKAIAYATDRKRLIDTVTFGVNVPGDGDQPRFLWAYNAQLRPLPYDPAKAKATLDAAGWAMGPDGIRTKNGTRLHLVFATTSGNAVSNRAAVVLQSTLREAGIEVEIKPYASSLMFASYAAGGILQGGKFDVEFSAWVNGPDPDDSTTIQCDQFPPHGQNIYHFCSHQLDALEKVALTHYDRATRKRAYDEIQTIMVDQLPLLTMWFNRRFDVVSDDLKNYRPAHSVSTFWNAWEYEI